MDALNQRWSENIALKLLCQATLWTTLTTRAGPNLRDGQGLAVFQAWAAALSGVAI